MAGPKRQRDRTQTARDFFPETVLVRRLYVGTKDEAISELINALCIEGVLDLSRENEVLKAIREREKVASTGIGGGIAIPHAKNKFVDRLGIAIGISEDGIDFGAHDNQAVRLVFCWLVPPSETKNHLAMMRTISSIGRDPDHVDMLAHARDRKAFLQSLGEIVIESNR